uniref:Uncharacterized protein n=1 Tax=Paramormyrops kingsleyae TaxID=1676925 RepID=A0A3B3QUK3_9TELE
MYGDIVYLAQFCGQFLGLRLFQLGNTSLTTDLMREQLVSKALYLRIDLCKGHRSAGLPVNQTTNPCLALDYAVGDSHLPA